MGNLSFYADADAPRANLEHYWELCVGSCHGYTALREDYRNQLRKAHRDIGFGYVRFHGILDDDMAVVQEPEPGVYRYNFFNIDCIFDFLLSIGMRPFMEIGFMPESFASGTKTCFPYRGNITMPKDFEAWDAFITEMMRHFIDRYGLAEVREWFFEVWNEPNLGFFFAGSQQDYFDLYEHTARAVKAADPSLRVGGPATALNAWIEEFIAYCEKKEIPLDFVTSHHYPTDDPLWAGDVDVETFFQEMIARAKENGTTIEEEHKKAQKYHRGVLTEMLKGANREAGRYPLYYTEWNTSANLPDDVHDYPYSAALVTKTVLDNIGLVKAYSFWTFTDIFEEHPQHIGEFHGGFGLQTVHGIPKPTYRAFELLHQLGHEQYPQIPEQGTVGMLMTAGENGGLRVLAYNQQIEDEPVETEEVVLTIAHAAAASATIVRIDGTHANARGLWDELGQPVYPDAKQMGALYEASMLREEPLAVEQTGEGVRVRFALEPNTVALIRLG